MAKNLNGGPPGQPAGPDHPNRKHGLSQYRSLKWNDEESIDNFLKYIKDRLSPESYETLKVYIRTLALDEELNLTDFEIKRIAIAMLMLDDADKWFFTNVSQAQWDEFKIELQKFLAGKEQMILNSLEKARANKKSKSKSLWDTLDDSFKDWQIKADGEIEGVDYQFQAKKVKKKFNSVTEAEAEASKDAV